MTVITVLIGGATMSIHQWTITEARAKFSEIIKKARTNGPQTITCRGRRVAVVTAAKEERKPERKGSLAEFLLASPFRKYGIEIKPLRGYLRKVDL
jgi:prevent-host-death family protein